MKNVHPKQILFSVARFSHNHLLLIDTAAGILALAQQHGQDFIRVQLSQTVLIQYQSILIVKFSLKYVDSFFDIFLFISVSYQAFMQRQPFIDFLCEIMRHSPLGKKQYANKDRSTKVSTGDLLNFFDIQYAGDYYQGERDFLVKHCRSR